MDELSWFKQWLRDQKNFYSDYFCECVKIRSFQKPNSSDVC